MRFRYGDLSPTYRTYRSSPPSEVIGKHSVSSHQIPSSQLHGQGRLQRVYKIEFLPSFSEEDDSATMPESDGILILGSGVSIPKDTHDVFENTDDIPSSQLTQRYVVPNSSSANVLSVQAQRIEKKCSILIGEHTLLYEPFPPAARLSILVVSMFHGSISEYTGLRAVGLVRRVLLGSTGFCWLSMYESLRICHHWDFLGYITGGSFVLLVLFLSFPSLRNVFCTYAVYYYTILLSSSLLQKTTASLPLAPLTLTDARIPQDPYCEFPHQPLLPPSYPAQYSLLAPLRACGQLQAAKSGVE
jgi:hypothetical protein